MKSQNYKLLIALLLSLSTSSLVEANVSVSNLFGDGMILQRDMPSNIWGHAEAGEKVTVSIAGKSSTTTTSEKGTWSVQLEPTAYISGETHELIIKGNNTLTFKNIVFGEVWLCSGQSNMEWSVSKSRDGDLNMLSLQNKDIRFLKIPKKGSQTPSLNFDSKWKKASQAEQLQHFSAVGFHFGKHLYEALDIPIGLIGCYWGGSSAEAWIAREPLEQADFYQNSLTWWKTMESYKTDNEAKKANLKEKMVEWDKKAASAKAHGKKLPEKPTGTPNLITGQHRPANIYNGMLKPIIGFSMRGVIWYQGESNIKQAEIYKDLFSLLITSWRKEWNIGDFSFYWVNLANFQWRNPQPTESQWAELREAQTETLSLPNTGQALSIDLGEGNDIHPRNKQDVANRLARIALAKDYGFNITYKNPQIKDVKLADNKIVATFKDVGEYLRTFNKDNTFGFSVAEEDGKFKWIKGKFISGNVIEFPLEGIKNPKEIRYGWGNNPAVNIYNDKLLPLTPFRKKL